MKESLYLKHPICRALNPQNAGLIIRRKLSDRLNPCAQYGLTISALIAFGRIPHIKTIPSFQMLADDWSDGKYEGIHTLVVPSSGNTAHAVARSDVPESKRGIISALASTAIISPEGGKSVEQEALELAQLPGHYLLDQYNHQSNCKAHYLYTGEAILEACRRVPDYIAIAMGSAGTLIGVSKFVKERHSQARVIGVRPAPGERVPGARDAARMASVLNERFRALAAEAADDVVEATRKESFIAMRQLWSEIEPQPGPTAGLAYRGLRSWLESLSEGKKRELAGRHAVFVCPDDGRFYSERIEGELDPDQGLVQ